MELKLNKYKFDILFSMCMRRFECLVVILFLCNNYCYGQVNCWSLEECIKYAYEHNIEIKTKTLDLEQKKLNISEQTWNFIPSISASNNISISSGRTLDPTTYDYVDNHHMVKGNSSSLIANLNLFRGFRNYYGIKRAKLDFYINLLSMEQAKNDLRLNITALYLEILYAKENIKILEQIIAEIRVQVDKTSTKVEAKKATIADLLQIKTQLSDAENNYLLAQQSYDLARLNLCQLLEIDDYSSFDVCNITCCDDEVFDNIIPEISMQIPLESIPKVQVAEKSIEIARYDMKIAQSSYYPDLSLSLGYGSSFSDARYRMYQNSDGTYRQELYPFMEQYKDNANSYISVSVNIPIFNKFVVRRNVQQKKIAIQRAEYALYQTKKQVIKEVTQAKIDIKTSYAKYNITYSAVELANEMVRQMTIKYELGVASVTDYNAAITSRYKALANMSQAKYEFIFKCKMLEYYMHTSTYM